MTRVSAMPAVGAKLHGMYGNNLTEDDYESMLHKHSVAELAAYLKSVPRFNACLGNIQEAEIHRGQLELLLRRALFDDMRRLRKYDRQSSLYAIYEDRIVLSLVVSCIGFLREDRHELFLQDVPGYLLGRIRLDLDAMVRAKDAQQLLNALGHSGFVKPLGKILADTGGVLPPVSYCAARLGEYYYASVLDRISHRYRGTERERMRSLVLAQVESKNLTVAYRMKKYFGADAEAIRRNLIGIFHTVRRREVESLLSAANAAEFESRLLATRVGRKMNGNDFSFIEYSVAKHHLEINHRAFRFATSPAVAFMSFLALREIELSNVLAIVEGIRYKVPAEEIRKLLVVLGR